MDKLRFVSLRFFMHLSEKWRGTFTTTTAIRHNTLTFKLVSLWVNTWASLWFLWIFTDAVIKSEFEEHLLRRHFFPTDLKPNLASGSRTHDLLRNVGTVRPVAHVVLEIPFTVALTNQFGSSETYFLSVRTTNWTQTRRLPVRVRRGLSQRGGQSRLSSCCLAVMARGERDSDVSQSFQDHGGQSVGDVDVSYVKWDAKWYGRQSVQHSDVSATALWVF